jgi:hypothetical protein
VPCQKLSLDNLIRLAGSRCEAGFPQCFFAGRLRSIWSHGRYYYIPTCSLNSESSWSQP